MTLGLRLFAAVLGLVGVVGAQSTRPPVVLVRGYDFGWLFGGCSASIPSDTFGTLPADLAAQGVEVLWFDNCVEADRKNVSIEALGQLFGAYLDKLGAPKVDVVAHSMGGLIVRAYLAGMKTDGKFAPPATVKVRKAVYVATPHFGFEELTVLTAADAQVTEMQQGSSFLYNLARWNQGVDDLRGVDSLAIAGSSGTAAAGPAGETDGLVSVNSASLASLGRTGRTRVVPYCHTGVLASLGYCGGVGVATAVETSAMVRSFLSGTAEWTTMGQAPGTGSGGVMFTARDANDGVLTLTKVTYDAAGSTLAQGQVAFKNFLKPGTYTFTGQLAGSTITGPAQVTGGVYSAVLLKTPPLLGAVIPSAGQVDARVVAPGELVSFYGVGLAEGTVQAPGLPLPTSLGGTRLTMNAGGATTELPLLVVSDGQVNAYVPPGVATGLATVTLATAKGKSAMTMVVAPAAFTFFTLNSSGVGAAILQHADGTLVTETNPALADEVVVAYGTGLGATRVQDGLDVAVATPEVFVGGVKAEVVFAGRTPGFLGLDQINLKVPVGIVTGNMVVLSAVSGGRTSNGVTVPVR